MFSKATFIVLLPGIAVMAAARSRGFWARRLAVVSLCAFTNRGKRSLSKVLNR